jgi:long-chain fatty acid transport protein
MRHFLPVLCGALTLVAACTQLANADGLIRDGVGAISTGRGGTNIAHSDNGAVLLDNPAGLVNFQGRGLFEVGLDTVICDLSYSDPFNDVTNDFKLLPVPHLSYIRTSADGRWAAGIGAFAPAGFAADYRMTNPIVGRHDYKSLGVLAKILPGVAYRVTDRLSVGGTLGVAVNRVELEGPFFLQTGALAGAPTTFDLRADGAALTWSAGLQYQLSDRTTLGVSYVSESRFGLSGTLDADIYGLAPVPIPGRWDADVDLVWPRTVGVGVTHWLKPRHRVSADVIWFDWSSAFDKMDIKLTNSRNPLFDAAVGPTIRDTLPFDWRDTVSMRLGYEYFWTPGDVFRAGYAYHRRPVPDATLNPYVDGVLEHAISVGYGKHWGSWMCNVGYQYSFGPTRTVGQSQIIGGDFDNSRFRAEAHWLMISLGRQF